MPAAKGAVSTLAALARRRARERPDSLLYTFLPSGSWDAPPAHLSRAELDRRSRVAAARLQRDGRVGDRAVLLFPHGLDFIAAFFGCLYAGVVAVPAYSPRRGQSLDRLRSIARDSQPRWLLTAGALRERVEAWRTQLPELAEATVVAVDELADAEADAWRPPEVDAESLAFLQYTSGSTAEPKGVMVSHRALLANLEAIRVAFGQDASSVVVSWLPLFHDMGLIGGVLEPLYTGARCVLLSPADFLRTPVRWLEAISRFRASTSGGPDFAYDLCVRKVGPTERERLELSSWVVAFDGSEPVRAATLDGFARAFAGRGFRRDAFFPCYGLAEATLFVSGRIAGDPVVIRRVEEGELERDRFLPVPGGGGEERGARELVSCGRAVEGRVAIVDPVSGRRLPAGAVGEIWVAGQSVTAGYWSGAEATAEVFGARIADEPQAGPFLRTGDLGALDGGELFVTGRLKDLLVVRGRNLYPHDLERTAEAAHPAVRPGSVAVFSVESDDREQVVVLVEVDRTRREEGDEVARAVHERVVLEHEAAPSEVVVLVPGAVPKTTSGKVRRRAARHAYLAGSLRGRLGGHATAGDGAASARSAPGRTEELTALTDLSALEADERQSLVQAMLRVEIGRAVGRPVAEIDPWLPPTRLGVDSLAAAEIEQALAARLGLDIDFGALLEAASLRELAYDLARRAVSEEAPDCLRTPILRAGRERTPLSYGQRALWLIHRLAPESAAYNVSAAMRVSAFLDPEVLRRAAEKVVARHDALRTAIEEGEEDPSQLFRARAPVDFMLEDAQDWAAERLEARLLEIAHRAFDLTGGSLFRLAVFPRSASETVLLVATHHTVSDFASMAVLTRDLLSLYSGRGDCLPPLPVSYGDYVLWQRERLAGEAGERMAEAWVRRLAGAPRQLDLPTDRPRPPVQTWVGAAVSCRLEGDDLAALRGVAGGRGTTLFMAVAAAFQTILARTTGQDDLLLGTVVAGRDRSEIREMVGYFANPVVLRGDLSGDPTFEEILARVKRAALDAFEDREYPFALVVKGLGLEPDVSRPPLVQATLVHYRGPREGREGLAAIAAGEGGVEVELEGLRVVSIALPQRTSAFDLSLIAGETDDRLTLSFQYNADLFDATTMRRALARLHRLLVAAAVDPEARVERLDSLGRAERHELLVERQGPAVVHPFSGGLPRGVEAQARRTPEAIAVVCGDHHLSFGELKARAGRLAALLREKEKVGRGDLVAVCLARDPDLVVALLAVLEAGAAYLPLDPGYPVGRLAGMLEDASARLLIGDPERRIPVSVRRLRLESRKEERCSAGLPSIGAECSAADLAYVLYTSGSTGRPKGVMVSHGAIDHHMKWMQRIYPLAPGEGVVQRTSVSFDASVWEFWAPLLVGGRLVLAPPEIDRDLDALVHEADRQRVAVLQVVPSLLRALLAETDLARMASVRRIFCGGEALGSELAAAVVRRTGAELINVYGPTEATIHASSRVVGSEVTGPSAPLGEPIDNGRLHLADRTLRPVARGVPGELLVGGAGLARGYLDRPSLTAERFVPDPFASRERAGERLYRTGDLARLRSDGELEFLGRTDHQVKVRGMRIELGEIESILARHVAVEEAAVVAQSRADGTRLTAFVKLRATAGADSGADLRAHLAARVPPSMVPADFIAVEALPRTANGKLDRRALNDLAQLSEAAAARGADRTLPRGPIEARLVEEWRAILGCAPGELGVHADPFTLGAESLAAMRMVARVRSGLGVELTLREVLERRTVAALARYIESAVAQATPAGLALEPVPREPPPPLSFAQERLWFLDRLEPGSSAYNVPVALRLAGELSAGRLVTAFAWAAERHESLRTSFGLGADGSPVQLIAREPLLALPVIDLSALPSEPRGAELSRRCRAEAARPFDLAAGLLVRLLLLRLGDLEHVLALTLHHAVCDGWSLGLLARELSEGDGRVGERPEVPEIQYADFAVWQRRLVSDGGLSGQLDRWQKRLAGTDDLELPTDRPRSGTSVAPARAVRVQVFEGTGERVAALARAEAVTPFMVLLAAWAVLLARLGGTRDVVVGTPVAGRDRPQLEGLIGLFVNTLALRVQPTGDRTFRQVLGAVRESVLDGYADRDLPFEMLVAALRPERALGRSPLVQAFYALERPPVLPTWEGLDVSLLEQESGDAKFDLALRLVQGAAGLSGTLAYHADLFDRTTALRTARHLSILLEGALRAPESPLAELSALAAAERHQLLVEWQGPGAHRDARTPWVAFLAAAERAPDALAIASGVESVSYGELAREASRLAGQLLARGVTPEERVGIAVPASTGQLTALLGVLGAGAAYVPLDLAEPAERLRRVIADAGVCRAVALAGDAPVLEDLALELLPLRQETREVSRLAGRSLPDGLAYVLFTSGSTGRPKGVMVENRALLHLAEALSAGARGAEEWSVVGMNAPLGFDASVKQWLHLLAGRTVHRIPEPVRVDPEALCDYVERHRLELLDTTPTQLRWLLRAGLDRRPGIALRRLLVGGEAIDGELWERIARAPFAAVNVYGPTEATVDAAAAPVVLGAEPTLGRALGATTLYVLDGEGRPTPSGTTGELAIGGPGVARGYLGRPAATAERFVPDFHGETPGGRLYRSGDLVRHRPGGELRFVGRADVQVKVQGVRIEPGEVEAALTTLPPVAAAVVVARRDERGHLQLVAYVVAAEDGAECEPGMLRAALAARLPRAMIPGLFVQLDALPRLASGKVDRRALCALPLATEPAEPGEPRTPLERIVAEVWTELLEAPLVGRRDDFFALGGHSLVAARVASRLSRELGTEVPLRLLFEHPRLDELARALAPGDREQSAPPALVAPERPESGEMPLSFAQERLWVLDRLTPGSPVYNIAVRVKLSGHPRPAALEASLRAVIGRHEVLRARFVERDGTPWQRIEPRVLWKLPRVDLSALGREAGERALGAVAVREARRPFDLASPPLLRTLLVRLSADEHHLVLTVHHIVFDGWSSGVLLREVAEIYGRLAEGAPPSLAPLAAQYADFAAWQRERLSGARLAALVDFWTSALRGAPAELRLPADRPRPARPSRRGALVHGHLGSALHRRLETRARDTGTSLFMLLLAGFQALLGRLTGSSDVLVGCPVAGRTVPETEPLLGFFVNVLVLRAEVVPERPFADLLRQARARFLAAHDHQELPFERLVEAVAPDRDLANDPLVQVLLVLQNAPRPALELGDLELELVPQCTGTSRVDLALSIEPEPNGLLVTAEFATDLFDRTTISRFLGAYRSLLAAAATDPERPITELPLLRSAERHQVVVEWRAGSSPVEALGSVIETVVALAQRSPDSLAVSDAGEAVSYGELLGRASSLAGDLRGRGAGPEVPVAVCLEPSAELIVAILGVSLAGAFYVALDPAHPDERLVHTTHDSGAHLVLCRQKDAGRFAALPGVRPLVAGRPSRGKAPRSSPSAQEVPGAHLAYVVYTSGSTGRPKGVAVGRASLAGLVAWHSRAYAPSRDDRASLLAAPGFDASVWEAWPNLAAGTPLVVPPAELRGALRELAAWLDRERITIAFLPTPLAEVVLQEGWRPRGLRALLTGGDRWRSGVGAEVPLYNHYGPTEATVVATFAPVAGRAAAPIGRPVDGAEVAVMDGRLRPVPVGVVGELVIAGRGLARGYLGRPAQTAERFVPDALGSVPGGRAYRTGDLTRWLASGELDFVGRADHQVKVRGHRIELGEVEAALLAHPTVAAAVVVAREVAGRGAELVAYVVGAEGVEPGAEALRAHLASRLPGAMVPSRFVAVTALPLTPNGKVDRRALPEPTPELTAADARDEAPRSPLEELVAGAWAEVLGQERVGRHDDFFALGGHSLLANRLVSRVGAVLGRDVPLSAIFEHPTPAALSAALEERSASALPEIRSADHDGPSPLSFAQERLWFLWELDPESHAYHVPIAVRVHGPLVAGRLRASLKRIVERHEILRTTITPTEEGPRQVVREPPEGLLPQVDLGRLPASLAAEVARRWATAEARRPFDLAAAPPLRCVLFTSHREPAMLLLVLHHVAFDGWSLDVLLRELRLLYDAADRSEHLDDDALPPLPVQYRDFARWQRRWLDTERLAGELAHWTERLRGIEPIELPADRARPPRLSHRAQTAGWSLAASDSRALRGMARRRGATLLMVLVASLHALLARLTGRTDVAVGTPIAGRRREELENLIGFFANLLVLRSELSGDPGSADLVRRAREAALAAYRHQDLPFERLVEELNPLRDLSRAPLAQVLLIIAPETRERSPAALRFERVPIEAGATKADLTIVVEESGDGLRGTVEASADLFETSTVARLGRQWETLLAGFADSAELRLSQLPVLSPAERHQLLVEWRVSGAPALDGVPVPERFSAWAGWTPEAIAVLDGSAHWSYAALAGWVERTAADLVSAGVGPEVRVGVLADRGAAMVAWILGVLEAGGCYVPLDPAYPAERLAFMLVDAEVEVLLRDRRVVAPDGLHEVRELVLDPTVPPGAAHGRSLSRPAPENLAYVLFTSGSTGRPKGVAIENRSTRALLHWADRVFTDREVARVAATTSICFDLSVFELFVPLSRGGTVVVVADALALRDLPGAERLTLVNTVPSAIAELVRSDGLPGGCPTVNLAGEPLARQTVDEIYAARPSSRVLNLYGPSEDTTYSTWTVAAPAGGKVAIGRPVDGAEVAVMDGRLRPVPVGVVGELVIAGRGLARGYLGRPAQTAERFVPDALGSVPGGRAYRTGDLTRWLASGELDFVGRADHQVKVRGHRIELGEVEAALLAHPTVAAAVVVAREVAGRGAELVAYVVGAEGVEPGAEALRAHLASRLPGAMVPSRFVAVTALPLTPNGKVDRRALPEPTPELTAADARDEAPRSPLEELVAGAWAEVLGQERVGRHDDFFALGGHSLLANQIAVRLRRVLDKAVPLRWLFEEPTVARLAARIAYSGDRSGPDYPLRPVPRDAGIPLSPAQERIWFLDQLEPGSDAFVIPTSARLRGELRPGALARSIAEVVRRHEPLRTAFGVENGRPLQWVAPLDSPPSLPLVDLGRLAPGRALSAARAGRLLLQRLPFDTRRAPLMRAVLVRLAKDDHVLFLDVHHLVTDGWSMRLVLRDLAAFYRGEVTPDGAVLPPLPVQYADVAAAESRWIEEGNAASRVERVKRRFSGELPVLDLPTDRPRPIVSSHRGGRCSRELSRELTAGLTNLGRRCGATPFMVLMTALAVLLGRWSRSREIVVGFPVATRERPELEGVVGLFLNTLALRVSLDGEPTFAALLDRVRRETLDAYEDREVPFELLLRELEIERDLSRSPLFDVFLNMLSFPVIATDLGGVTLELLPLPRVTSKFDATIYASLNGERLQIDWVYDADLFDAARAEDQLAQLTGVLELAVAEPERAVAAISLVTPAAARVLPDPREALDGGWAGAIQDHLRGWARRAPDRIAVGGPGALWSYRAVDRLSDRVADLLAAVGHRPGEVVAVVGHRSPALVWAILGALKAGGIYLVLDPAYPAGRLVAYLEAAGPAAVLRMEAAGALPAPVGNWLKRRGCPALGLSRDGSISGGGVAQSPPARPLVEPGPHDFACLTFTSGSSGTPKGVVGRLGPLTHFVPWQSRRFDLDGDDRFAMLAGLAHDPLQRDIFTPLQLGGTVVAPDPEDLGRPGWLTGWLARERITICHLTPAMIQWLPERPQETADGLRWAFFVGAVLTRRDVSRLVRAAPAVRCVNLYGTTETQRAVSYFAVDATLVNDPSTHAILPIGRGVRSAQLLVTSGGGRLSGIGEVGEITLRSPHLASGYLDDPRLTASRFSPDSFGGSVGGRVYETGDLGVYLPDGTATVLGRADRQLSVRGFRVEPAEVETALVAHPGVREAAVVARVEAGEPSILVAYVVTRGDGAAFSPRTLREHLAATLPSFMVPSTFVGLEALPLTPNGKLDVRALPQPPVDHDASPTALGSAEELLAALWEAVLGIEVASPEADFFELGGHSLLVTRLLARIQEAFGVELALREIFETPRLRDLARTLESRRSAFPPASLLPIARVPRDRDLPLSSGQERLWFLSRLDPESAAYNMPSATSLDGALDAKALGAALTALARRHEMLRTRFPEVAGRPVQRIEPPRAVPLPVVDLTGLPGEQRASVAAQIADEDASRPFDPREGPPWRATLVRLASRRHRLLLDLHHMIADGWSLGILVRELADLYETGTAKRPAGLPALEVQYADYAVWQRAWLGSSGLERQLEYWTTRLAGIPADLELPTDRSLSRGNRGGRRPFALGRERWQALRRLGREHGATPFMVLLAGLQSLLFRLTGEDDLTIGAPVANRCRPELEPLVGFFVNTLALRGRVSGSSSFAELIEATRTAILDDFANADLPFDRLVEALNPERRLGRAALFQVMLAFQNPAGAPRALSDLTMVLEEIGFEVARRDLTIRVHEREGVAAGVFEYDADRFDPTSVDRLAATYAELLAVACAEPKKPVAGLPVMSRAQLHQVRHEWNGSHLPLPAVAVHRLVEAAARATPDRTAVVAPDGELTYGQLWAQSRALARRLARLGVGPEVPVAVCLPRSGAAIVSILAVLEAGGAFAPLDPSLPPGRLAQLLTRLSPRAVLAAAETVRSLPAASLRSATAFDPRPIAASVTSGAEVAAPAPDPRTLAYLLFTSGTTGEPKSVAVEHRQILDYVLALTSCLSLGRGASYALVSTLSADLGYTILFAALTTGGTLHIVDRATSADPVRMAERFRGRPVDGMKIVPTHLEALLAHPDAREILPRRWLISGGERLPWSLVEKVDALTGGCCRVVNHYGPTESTVGITVCEVGRLRGPREGSVPIGRALPNVLVRVVDRAMREVPIGARGELLAGGTSPARGYRNQTRETAERFVPDPDAEAPGARAYRTGDLVARLPGGDLGFRGRIDRQVKVRGYRVEVEEIEAALARLPGLQEVTVVLRDDPGAGPRLVAYLVGDGGSGLVARARAALLEALPAYMVPTAFVTLDALPRTPNGKLDQRALPAPSQAPAPAAVGALTETEATLAALWEELLDVEVVGSDDDFFDLGGHSLLATRLLAKIREAFDLDLPLDVLFRRPALGRLAGEIECALGRGAVFVERPVEPVPRDRALPLSFGQLRFWTLARLDPGSPVYNIVSAFRVRGALDPSALRAAFGAVVGRHEVLRTAFPAGPAGPVQRILPVLPPALPVVDLRALPAAEKESEGRRLAARLGREPFDLERPPLFRVAAVRLETDNHLIALVLHHIVSDGWSKELLVHELLAVYEAARAGERPRLPELPVQYADFAVWQRRTLDEDRLRPLLEYWTGRLASPPPPLELAPAPLRGDGAAIARGDRLALAYPRSRFAELQTWVRRRGATPFMALLAGFAVLLHHRSGRDDLIVGSPITHRGRPEIEGLIGFFLNVLPLRIDLSGDPTIEELLARVRETCLGAYAHRDMPFERLVDELRLPRDGSRNPLFQVAFTLQAPSRPIVRPGAFEIEPVEFDREWVPFDLVLNLVQDETGLGGGFLYRSDRFDRALMGRLGGQLHRILGLLPGDGALCLSALSGILAESERSAAEVGRQSARLAARSKLERVLGQRRSTPTLRRQGVDG
jgi:amino acid adenylation domain-containing protein